MGLWERHVVPRIVDKFGGIEPIQRLRAEVTEGLHGDVVEIGFGSGHNLPHLPTEVKRVWAVDPSATGQRLAAERLEASTVPVSFVGLDAEKLPLDSGSADSALSTMTLCSIPDVSQALAEIRRVLRPGGSFHFLDHGLSPDSRVAKWQHRLTPLQRRVCGGCHFNRPIDTLIADAGLEVTELRNLYLPGPKTTGYLYLGTARNG